MNTSKQVKKLRELADCYHGGIRDYASEILQAADTIESLSAKLSAANMEQSKELYIWEGVPDTTQRRLREKYEQKKPTKCETYGDYATGVCPHCRRLVHDIYNYCPHCGQHFDWNDIGMVADGGGWIPCSERLPEPGYRYRVSVIYEEDDYALPGVYDSVYGTDGLWHSDNYEVMEDCTVMAWKSIEEPYHEP